MLQAAVYNNPVGLHFRPVTAIVYNRVGSTVAAGRVYQLDMTQSATEVTTYEGSGADSVFGNIVNSSAAGADGGITVVALETKGDNEKVKVGLAGIFDVNVEGTNATTVGEALHAKGGTALDSDASSGARQVGIALQATAAASAEAVKVLFDGTGLGVK